MAFLRVRGKSISLIQGVRHEDFGVRHRRLYTFPGGLDTLREHLRPEAWAKIQLDVEQRHPDVVADWNRLREDAQALLQREEARRGPTPPPPTFEDHVDGLRRASRKLSKELLRMRRHPEAERIVRSAGPELVEACKWGLLEFARLVPADVRADVPRMLELILPDQEAAFNWVERGRHFNSQGKPAQARKDFEMARRLDPLDPDIDNSAGVGYLDRGRLDEAAQLFEKARELAYHQLPDRQKMYSWGQHEIRPYLRATANLALVRERQGRYEEALELNEECLRRCPSDGVGARFLLGPLHLRLGRLHQALDQLEAHCRGNMLDLADPFFDLANVLVRLHRPAEALERLLEGMRINLHVPKLLLKPPKRFPALPSHDSDHSKTAALSYVQHSLGLWTEESLAFVARVVADAEVREQMSRCEQLEAAAEKDRSAWWHEWHACRDGLFPEAFREGLRGRVLG